MSAPLTPERLALEWKVLRLLCHARMQPGAALVLSPILQAHHFREPANRIIYEELLAIGSVPYERLREFLSTRVTRRGLPDVDFDELFLWPESTENLAAEMVHTIKRLVALDEIEESPLAS
jgi:hypothetical protein